MPSSVRLLAPLPVLLMAATTAAQTSTSATDYPQWRGPQRDGSVHASIRPDAWPDRLVREWRVEIGEGYATPLVVGDFLYTFTRRNGEEVMSALDASTGDEIWSTGYSAPYSPSVPAASHGAGPKATPAFRDGRLFTLGISGIVAAFEAATGELLWRTEAPSEPPFFSAASSPVVEADLVMAHPGNYGPLTAFDATTGQVRWSVGGDGFFAAPLVTTLAGTRQAITMTRDAVIGVSLPEGQLLWEYPWASPGGGPMPVVRGEMVIVSSFDEGMAAFTPALSAGRWTVDSLWETNEVSLYLSHPVVVDDTLFGFSHRSSGQFFALDVNTGSTLWLGPPRQATHASVVTTGDVLLFLQDDGELVIATSSRTGFEPLKRYGVGESATWAQPVLFGNRLLTKAGTSLSLWTLD